MLRSFISTFCVKSYAEVTDEGDLEAIREESLEELGYFLKPAEMFGTIVARGNVKVDEDDEETAGNFILEDLQSILNAIEQSTMGNDSEDDFNKLFEDIDLASTKLGRSPAARNTLIAKVLAGQIAALCTFRHEGREPAIRCKCNPRMLHQSDPTFKLAPIRARLCSAEGSTERILPGFTFVANGCCRNVARNGQQPLGFGTGIIGA
jgi:hypothetical protein